MEKIIQNKEKFINLMKENVKREGIEKFIQWLEITDFFEAPASTKFHSNCAGGLCEHSLKVYSRLLKMCSQEKDLATMENFSETIAICGLLHDICKVNTYKTEMRNTKDATGNWVKVPYYTVEDNLPYGHGEKSVYIISGFLHLNRAEAMAIRWHMGGFDDSVKAGNYSISNAFIQNKIAVMLHTADLLATYCDEEIQKSTANYPKG